MSKFERLSRLFKIVTLVTSRRQLGRKDLAELCEVSVRTIQRDVASLCYAGVPIFWSEPTGYHIMPEFFLPPLNLTLEEVSRLASAVKAYQRKRKVGNPAHSALDMAMSKILAGLPSQTRDALGD